MGTHIERPLRSFAVATSHVGILNALCRSPLARPRILPVASVHSWHSAAEQLLEGIAAHLERGHWGRFVDFASLLSRLVRGLTCFFDLGLACSIIILGCGGCELDLTLGTVLASLPR